MMSKAADAKKTPWSNLTLKWNPRNGISTTQYVLYAVQIATLIILEYLSIVMLGPLSYSGVSFFFFATPFTLLFTLWWGIWGMIGSFLGNAIGAGLMVGMGVVPAFLYSPSMFIPQLLVFVVYRGFLSKRGIDPLWRDLVYKDINGYKAKRLQAWLWFILFAAIASQALSAEMGVGTEYLLGLIPAGAYWFWWAGWFMGDTVSTIILAPILIRGLTGLIERQGLLNIGWVT